MSEIQPSAQYGTNLSSVKPEELNKNARGVEQSRAIEANERLATSDDSSEKKAQNKEQLVREVRENLEKINQFIPVTETNLSFEFDENGEPPVVKVIDSKSEEVIREIPSEEFREMAKALEEFADKVTERGVLFDRTA